MYVIITTLVKQRLNVFETSVGPVVLKPNKEAGLTQIHSLPLLQLDLDLLFVDVEHRSTTWGQRVTGDLPLSKPKGGNVNL